MHWKLIFFYSSYFSRFKEVLILRDEILLQVKSDLVGLWKSREPGNQQWIESKIQILLLFFFSFIFLNTFFDSIYFVSPFLKWIVYEFIFRLFANSNSFHLLNFSFSNYFVKLSENRHLINLKKIYIVYFWFNLLKKFLIVEKTGTKIQNLKLNKTQKMISNEFKSN